MNGIDINVLSRRIFHMVSPKRFGHIRGVSATAKALASRYGEGVDKAELAGWLHDAMRSYSDEQLLQLADEYGLYVDEYTKKSPSLLHGPVAAAWAQRELGITDEEVLEAIRAHTVGDASMDKLTCIIYLSDAMEPGRRYEGVEELRKLSETSLYRATFLALEQSREHLLKRGRIPHPIYESAKSALTKKIEEEK